jgi:hypothetical protein
MAEYLGWTHLHRNFPEVSLIISFIFYAAWIDTFQVYEELVKPELSSGSCLPEEP